MYKYTYVTKNEAMSIKKELIDIISKVQDKLRDEFTFQFNFVGSDKRNMITCDPSQNIGFDFDINITPNDSDDEFTAKELKEKLMDAFNKVLNPVSYMVISPAYYGYSNCEDSTRVFTIKVKDRENSRIAHSADFCIVNKYNDKNGVECEEYIRYNKKSGEYFWTRQSKSFIGLDKKIKEIKNNKLWGKVRDVYIYKKNINTDKNKRSRSLFAETINEVYKTI